MGEINKDTCRQGYVSLLHEYHFSVSLSVGPCL